MLDICSRFLVLTKYAEIRRRVLDKYENEPNLTLQNLAEDCQRFINVRQYTKDIEASDLSHINKYVKKIKWKRQKILLQTPVTRVENYIFITTVHTKQRMFSLQKRTEEKSWYFAEKWKPRRAQDKCFRGFQKDSGLCIQAEGRKMRLKKKSNNLDK